ncbi:hypothetical protein Scep_019320 [Stephania cephalantha]|uniref:Uncharacterized protein n=1 Tax=Stephania cephalantha TaxID=152367 RepID=A0AAP0IAG6_9MAGN
MESEKRLQDKFNGRRKLNGCAAACWLCLVIIVLLFGLVIIVLLFGFIVYK